MQIFLSDFHLESRSRLGPLAAWQYKTPPSYRLDEIRLNVYITKFEYPVLSSSTNSKVFSKNQLESQNHAFLNPIAKALSCFCCKDKLRDLNVLSV